MSIDFSSSRLSYEKDELVEDKVPTTPYELFNQWLQEAITEKVLEPYAMSLATCGNDMRPSVRTVLMREVNHLADDNVGIVFYTNYDSEKGENLADNNQAEVLFFWQSMERQVRISGTVTKLTEEKSTDYFHKRPHTSQVAACVSTPQSGVVESREALDDKFTQLLAEYPESSTVPKPEFWGGYQIVAEDIEFWQGRASRMHDRILYSKNDEDNAETSEWIIQRLMP